MAGIATRRLILIGLIMDLSSFTDLQKQSKKSFNDQKALIKKVLAGRTINCQSCKQPLNFLLAKEKSPAKICCEKGCTDIELDIG